MFSRYLTIGVLLNPENSSMGIVYFTIKVFVANPTKAKPILDILLKNKDKLIDFLSKFHTDRTGM